MTTSAITCLVPTHNRPQFLRRLLKFYGQFPPSFAISVVDSSCPDTAAQNVAAIQAAKRCDELIPLCHSLPLDAVDVTFDVQDTFIQIRATASTTAKTGVEMEALTAASIAALTIYDMCKAVDKTMVVTDLRVVEKVKE